jgi:hypothetical protein
MSHWQHLLARACYLMGEYQEAVVVARQVCQTHPHLHSAWRTLLAGLGQTGQTEEAQRIMAESMERFGEGFRALMGPVETADTINRAEDQEHLREGWRKAGVLD